MRLLQFVLENRDVLDELLRTLLINADLLFLRPGDLTHLVAFGLRKLELRLPLSLLLVLRIDRGGEVGYFPVQLFALRDLFFDLVDVLDLVGREDEDFDDGEEVVEGVPEFFDELVFGSEAVFVGQTADSPVFVLQPFQVLEVEQVFEFFQAVLR